MAAQIVGLMQEFNPDNDNETVTTYFELFQLFVDAITIAEDKLIPTLLTVVGSKHYSLIRGLVSPCLPSETYGELVSFLKKHYDPEPERYRFYQRSQRSGESVVDFLACLRCLAGHCQSFSEALHDRFVCGIQSRTYFESITF